MLSSTCQLLLHGQSCPGQTWAHCQMVYCKFEPMASLDPKRIGAHGKFGPMSKLGPWLNVSMANLDPWPMSFFGENMFKEKLDPLQNWSIADLVPWRIRPMAILRPWQSWVHGKVGSLAQWVHSKLGLMAKWVHGKFGPMAYDFFCKVMVIAYWDPF